MPLIVLRHGRVGDLVGSAATFEEQKAAEPAWRSFQEGLASQSDRGRLRVIEDSGHLIANERPEAVVAAVQDVLEMAAQ
jgi:pimeloyl-ACP methyl ester carboxylesterase